LIKKEILMPTIPSMNNLLFPKIQSNS